MRSRSIKHLLLAVLILLCGGAPYLYYHSNRALPPEQRYRLQTVEETDIAQTVSANGTLNPVVLVNVGTQVSGTVTKLYVDFNDHVKEGQLLLELDRSLFAAQAKQSQANIGNIKATLELARANERRMQTLFAEEYVSRQELEQATQARKSAEAQLVQSQASAEKDQVNLNYTQIRSPVSGIVVDRVVDLGQTVAASLQTPTLIKIAQDLSEMRIDSSFAEADVGKIKTGQKVNFTVDAYPNRSFTGEVQQIRLNPTITQNVVTYNVRVSLQNPEQILLPGMTAYVNIEVARRDKVLAAPNAALRFKPSEAISTEEKTTNSSNNPDEKRTKKRDSSGGTVYRVENGQIKALTVRLGISDNRNSEVISGALKVGDQLIVGELPVSNSKPSSMGFRLF